MSALVKESLEDTPIRATLAGEGGYTGMQGRGAGAFDQQATLR